MKLRNKERKNYNVDDGYNNCMPPFMEYKSMTLNEINLLPTTHLPIDRIYIPQITSDDNKLWVQMDIARQKRPHYISVRAAIDRFTGDEKRQSYISFLNEQRFNPWMNNLVWKQIKKEIYVKIKPHLNKGDYCFIVKDELELEIQFVKIISISKSRTAIFNEVDEFSLYNVHHFDPREDQLTLFTVKSGSGFNLRAPKGAVKESWLVYISSELIINGIDYGFIEATRLYWKLKTESLQTRLTNAKVLFQTTIKQSFVCIASKIRGRCTRKNEGKIFIDTYNMPGVMMTSTLNQKFRQIKQLKQNESFIQKGESTYSVFAPEEAAKIYQAYNLNRDFDENGTELLPNIDSEEDIDYTMSISAIIHRSVAAKNKFSVKYNVSRLQYDVNGEDKIYGVSKDWTDLRKQFAIKKSRKRKAEKRLLSKAKKPKH